MDEVHDCVLDWVLDRSAVASVATKNCFTGNCTRISQAVSYLKG